MTPSRAEFPKGATIYITKTAWPTRAQLIERCKPLTVKHATDKAVLVTCGDSEQWFPYSALTPSSNNDGIYLLAKWLKLRQTWALRCGAERKRKKAA